ncbi:MAG: hypothetical protein KDC92_08015 [Bacteroidetes bacterium]|nr:hypothetical protein [Bacteroidota bacterium]
MAGGKETPRQKMIGMMYLVLTALLALNVSAEVLQAFNNITIGIKTTIDATEEKNAELMKTFEQRVANSEGDETATQCLAKVKEAKKKTQALYDKLEELKKLCVEGENSQAYGEVGGDPESYLGSGGEILIEQKNTDISSRLLSGDNPKFTHGQDLKAQINQTKAELVALFKDIKGVRPETIEQVENAITLVANDDETRKKPKDKWEYYTFNNIPVGATIAVLTKLQNDVMNAETEVINQLFNQISAAKIEIEDFETVVKQNKAILARGEELEAKIFLSAIVGSITPEITVNNQPVEMEGATGIWKRKAGEQGKFEEKVSVKVKNAKTGESKEYPATINYEVFSADATISATKMNVLYLGLDNPIQISVPGYEPKAISASLTPSSVGSLVPAGKPGEYIAKIKSREKDGCKIVVNVKNQKGEVLPKGSQVFRTMKVPSPYANLNNKTGGSISAAELKVVRTVNATLDNFVFEGIRYTVTGYDFIYSPKRGTLLRGKGQGAAIADQLKGAFANAKRGDQIIINGIQASAPGVGKVDLPGALIFDVQ